MTMQKGGAEQGRRRPWAGGKGAPSFALPSCPPARQTRPALPATRQCGHHVPHKEPWQQVGQVDNKQTQGKEVEHGAMARAGREKGDEGAPLGW